MTTAILKWVGIMIVNLLGLLTSIVVFPLAYILRDVKIVRNKILWIYMMMRMNLGGMCIGGW